MKKIIPAVFVIAAIVTACWAGIVCQETFETTLGYDESWTDISNGAHTLDPDYDVTTIPVLGDPGGWGLECCRLDSTSAWGLEYAGLLYQFSANNFDISFDWIWHACTRVGSGSFVSVTGIGNNGYAWTWYPEDTDGSDTQLTTYLTIYQTDGGGPTVLTSDDTVNQDTKHTIRVNYSQVHKTVKWYIDGVQQSSTHTLVSSSGNATGLSITSDFEDADFFIDNVSIDSTIYGGSMSLDLGLGL